MKIQSIRPFTGESGTAPTPGATYGDHKGQNPPQTRDDPATGVEAGKHGGAMTAPEKTDDTLAESIRALQKADRGGSLAMARNLAPADRSVGSGETLADVMETREENKGKEGGRHGEPSLPGPGPGQGYDPAGALAEESPVVRGPVDQKILDGEGNLTDAASEVDSLEQGDGANGGDGGDAGGQADGMFRLKSGTAMTRNKFAAEGDFDKGPDFKSPPMRKTDELIQKAKDLLHPNVARNYQAPGGPDSPYPDTPGNPSQDPLAVTVDSMRSHLRPVGPSLTQEALARITPDAADTALRQPTAISGEIGGRSPGGGAVL